MMEMTTSSSISVNPSCFFNFSHRVRIEGVNPFIGRIPARLQGPAVRRTAETGSQQASALFGLGEPSELLYVLTRQGCVADSSEWVAVTQYSLPPPAVATVTSTFG